MGEHFHRLGDLMDEKSDWSDEPDILNSKNFSQTDEQLEYEKSKSSKGDKLLGDLDKIKSLISEVQDSRGFITLRGESFVTELPDMDFEITHVFLDDYPGVSIIVEGPPGNIDLVTFHISRSRTSVRITAPMVIIEDLDISKE